MRRSQNRGRRTVYTELGFWWNPDTQCIHLATQDSRIPDGHVRISNDPSKRYGHPRVFNLLAQMLQIMGAPSPLPPEPTHVVTRRDRVAFLQERGADAAVLMQATDADIEQMYTAAHQLAA